MLKFLVDKIIHFKGLAIICLHLGRFFFFNKIEMVAIYFPAIFWPKKNLATSNWRPTWGLPVVIMFTVS